MRIHEIDWRYSSIAGILNAVSAALENIKTEILPEDVDEALEQTESFLGISFVAAQTYIKGAEADAVRLAKANGKGKIDNPLKKFNDTIPNTHLTKIELCDGIANYFKHEWPNWNPKPKRIDEPRRVLYDAGLTEAMDYPCQEAAKILWGFTSSDLSPLLFLIEEWRKKLIAACK